MKFRIHYAAKEGHPLQFSNEVLKYLGHSKLWNLVCSAECLGQTNQLFVLQWYTGYTWAVTLGLQRGKPWRPGFIKCRSSIKNVFFHLFHEGTTKTFERSWNKSAYIIHEVRNVLSTKAALFPRVEARWLPSHALSALNMSIDGSVPRNKAKAVPFPSRIAAVQLSSMSNSIVKRDGVPVAAYF